MQFDVFLVLDQLVAHLLPDVGGHVAQREHPFGGIHDEMETVELVEHGHVERRGGGAFFLVAPDMDVRTVLPPVGEAVDQPGIAVIGEYDGFVRGEEGNEFLLGKTMGMLLPRLQRHQVDHVDDPDPEVRREIFQDFDRGQRFKRGHVPAAGHHQIGLSFIVGGRPFPDSYSRRNMLDRGIHGEPLKGGLLAGDDDVDVVAALEAVIGDAEQGIGVGRQIDPDDVRFLVDDMIDEARVLMGEAVVVLPPDMGSEQIIEGSDRAPPRDFAACRLQPLRMLVEHRIDEMDEGFVAGKQSMPSGQQIAFQPALAGMLGKNFHHPAVRGKMVVVIAGFEHPGSGGSFQYRAKSVGGRLVGAEQPEIVDVLQHHVPEQIAHHPGCFRDDIPGFPDLHFVVPEIRHPEVLQQHAAVCLRVRTHAAIPFGGELLQFRSQFSVFVEKRLRPVGFHPGFEQFEMPGIFPQFRKRNLVASPEAFRLFSVHFFRTGPSFRRAQYDHGPHGPRIDAFFPGISLDFPDFGNHDVHRFRHFPVHVFGVLAFDEIGPVAVSLEKVFKLFVAYPGEQGRIGDLVAVEMEDRQHCAVALRIQEFVRMPGSRHRSRFRFAVAHHAAGDEFWVVEYCAIGMGNRIAELPAFMNRAGGLGRHMARDAAGKGELPEEALQPFSVFGDIGVEFAVAPLEIGVRNERRPAVPRSREIDHVEVEFFDRPVHVQIDEIEPRRRSPVAEQPGLDVIYGERDFEERIVIKIDLPDREVIRRAPVGVHFFHLVGCQRRHHSAS